MPSRHPARRRQNSTLGLSLACLLAAWLAGCGKSDPESRNSTPDPALPTAGQAAVRDATVATGPKAVSPAIPTEPTVLRVPDEIPDLPLALLAAEPGAVIELGPGEYPLESFVFDRPLWIRGAGREQTRLLLSFTSADHPGVLRFDGLTLQSVDMMSFPPPVLETTGTLALNQVTIYHPMEAMGIGVASPEVRVFYRDTDYMGTPRTDAEEPLPVPEPVENPDEPLIARTAPLYRLYADAFYAAGASSEQRADATRELLVALAPVITEVVRAESPYENHRLAGRDSAYAALRRLHAANGDSDSDAVLVDFVQQQQDVLQTITGYRPRKVIRYAFRDQGIDDALWAAYQERHPMEVARDTFRGHLRAWRRVSAPKDASATPRDARPSSRRFLDNLAKAIDTLPESIRKPLSEGDPETRERIAGWIYPEREILEAVNLWPDMKENLSDRERELAAHPAYGWYFELQDEKSWFKTWRPPGHDTVLALTGYSPMLAQYRHVRDYDRAVRLDWEPLDARVERVIAAADAVKPGQFFTPRRRVVEAEPTPDQRAFWRELGNMIHSMLPEDGQQADLLVYRCSRVQRAALKAGFDGEQAYFIALGTFNVIKAMGLGSGEVIRSLYLNSPPSAQAAWRKIAPNLAQYYNENGTGFRTTINGQSVYMHENGHPMTRKLKPAEENPSFHFYEEFLTPGMLVRGDPGLLLDLQMQYIPGEGEGEGEKRESYPVLNEISNFCGLVYMRLFDNLLEHQDDDAKNRQWQLDAAFNGSAFWAWNYADMLAGDPSDETRLRYALTLWSNLPQEVTRDEDELVREWTLKLFRQSARYGHIQGIRRYLEAICGGLPGESGPAPATEAELAEAWFLCDFLLEKDYLRNSWTIAAGKLLNHPFGPEIRLGLEAIRRQIDSNDFRGEATRYMLGIFYRKGYGIAPDPVLAERYLRAVIENYPDPDNTFRRDAAEDLFEFYHREVPGKYYPAKVLEAGRWKAKFGSESKLTRPAIAVELVEAGVVETVLSADLPGFPRQVNSHPVIDWNALIARAEAGDPAAMADLHHLHRRRWGTASALTRADHDKLAAYWKTQAELRGYRFPAKTKPQVLDLLREAQQGSFLPYLLAADRYLSDPVILRNEKVAAAFLFKDKPRPRSLKSVRTLRGLERALDAGYFGAHYYIGHMQRLLEGVEIDGVTFGMPLAIRSWKRGMAAGDRQSAYSFGWSLANGPDPSAADRAEARHAMEFALRRPGFVVSARKILAELLVHPEADPSMDEIQRAVTLFEAAMIEQRDFDAAVQAAAVLLRHANDLDDLKRAEFFARQARDRGNADAKALYPKILEKWTELGGDPAAFDQKQIRRTGALGGG